MESLNFLEDEISIGLHKIKYYLKIDPPPPPPHPPIVLGDCFMYASVIIWFLTTILNTWLRDKDERSLEYRMRRGRRISHDELKITLATKLVIQSLKITFNGIPPPSLSSSPSYRWIVSYEEEILGSEELKYILFCFMLKKSRLESVLEYASP